jgi:hypothetical protein
MGWVKWRENGNFLHEVVKTRLVFGWEEFETYAGSAGLKGVFDVHVFFAAEIGGLAS